MKILNIFKETAMNTLFKKPANDSDLRFVMRCLWALDPDRHLFAGDFRDYARVVFERWLSSKGRGWDLPSECVDEIGQLAQEFPCSSEPTRRCWQGIAGHMKAHLHSVHIMQLAQDDSGQLEEFVRGSFPGGGGKYCVIEEDLPRELLMVRWLGFNATLEAVAGELRDRLDPKTVTGAILLWTLWCIETKWPQGKALGHYRTTFSLSWQIVREVQWPRKDRDAWGISRLVSMGADLRAADTLMRRGKGGRSLAHGFAMHATVRQFALLRKAGLPLDDPDDLGIRPLQQAILYKKWRNAEWLLNQGADPNSRPRHLDQAIVLCGEKMAPISLLLSLLERGVDPNLRGRCRRTALHAAAYTGNLRGALELIARGADLEAVDSLGHTPLCRAVFAMVAGEGSRLPVIEVLVSAGASTSGPLGLPLNEFLLRARELGASAATTGKILRALKLQ